MRRILTEPDIRLIDLAFDSGFDSQEAFTQAFAKAFGHPPGPDIVRAFSRGEVARKPRCSLRENLVCMLRGATNDVDAPAQRVGRGAVLDGSPVCRRVSRSRAVCGPSLPRNS